MGRETKIGLLVGLCFIVCFAIILSHRGEVRVAGGEAAFEVATTVRRLPVSARPLAPPAPATAAPEGAGTGEFPPAPSGRMVDGSPPRGAHDSASTANPEADVVPVPDAPPVVAEAADRGSRVDGADRFTSRMSPLAGPTGEKTLSNGGRAPGRLIVVGGAEALAHGPLRLNLPLTHRERASRSSPTSDGAVLQSGVPSRALGQAGQPAGEERNAPETNKEPAARVPATPKIIATHVVQPGDNLTRIARKHYGSTSRSIIKAIFEANRSTMSSPDHLVVGWKVMLPAVDGHEARGTDQAAATAAAGVPAPAESGAGKAPKERSVERRRPNSRGREGVDWKWYQLKAGDVYSTVAAEQLGTSRRWPELAKLNEDIFPDASRIRYGVSIRIPIDRSKRTTTRAVREGA